MTDDSTMNEIRDLLMRLDIRIEIMARQISDLEHELIKLQPKRNYYPDPSTDPRQWKIEKRYRQPTMADYAKWRESHDGSDPAS